jgi:hypothetical protein
VFYCHSVEAEFSEFSYGYAAARESEALLSAVWKQAGAPELPSLKKEKNLGYDLGLPFVGYALYLQFKRATFVSRHGPGSPTWSHIGAPHYRYRIDTAVDQHQTLLTLETRLESAGFGEVLYASPLFHRQSQFDASYLATTILTDSLLVPPSEIGRSGVHHVVATTPGVATILSEPRAAERVTTWNRLETDNRRRAIRAAQQNDRPSLTVRDLALMVEESLAFTRRDFAQTAEETPLDYLYRTASLMGCGLALIALDDELF